MYLLCHIVHKTVMVQLYPCLLSVCSALATPVAAEDVSALVCFGGHVYYILYGAPLDIWEKQQHNSSTTRYLGKSFTGASSSEHTGKIL